MRVVSDSDMDESEQYATETEDSMSIVSGDISVQSRPKAVVRARSAKDLVKRQEDLITMLQKMKSDLSKMDREASQIKEDVVRSNQVVNVMVHMKQPHHLTPSPDGYNFSYSLPKVTYTYNRRQRTDSGFRHLNQLSTYPACRSNSRCSSVASHHGSHHGRYSDRASSYSGTDDPYSGTESECEAPDLHRRQQATRRSSDSQDEAAGSSTESGRTSPENNACAIGTDRRQSYFFAPVKSNQSEDQVSDEVEI